MFVMYSADNLNFRLEFSLSLSTSRLQLLNRYFFTIRKNTFVHIPKTTLSKKVRFREAIGCPR